MSTNILNFPVGEANLLVTYSYTPGTPDTMYKPNGDPGDPGDPEEFEVEAVTVAGVDITEVLLACSDEGDEIPSPFLEAFYQHMLDHIKDEADAAAESAAEARAELERSGDEY